MIPEVYRISLLYMMHLLLMFDSSNPAWFGVGLGGLLLLLPVGFEGEAVHFGQDFEFLLVADF